jgi:hypothetical protein
MIARRDVIAAMNVVVAAWSGIVMRLLEVRNS